jgi:hypothetical protein
MAISDILASIDSDLAKLREARELLSGGTLPAMKKKAGRPKKVAAATKSEIALAPVVAKPAKKKRKLSPEGRMHIAEAVQRRWAQQK